MGAKAEEIKRNWEEVDKTITNAPQNSLTDFQKRGYEFVASKMEYDADTLAIDYDNMAQEIADLKRRNLFDRLGSKEQELELKGEEINQSEAGRRKLLAEIESIIKIFLNHSISKVIDFIDGITRIGGGTMEEVFDNIAKEITGYDTKAELEAVLNGETVKTIIEKQNQIKTELEQVKTENSQVKTEIEQVKNEKETIKTEIEQVKGEIEQVKNELEQVKGENSQVKIEKETLKTELEQIKGDRDNRPDITPAELEQIKTELEQVKTENEKDKTELEQNKTELEKVKGELEQVKGERDNQSDNTIIELEKTKTELEQIKTEKGSLETEKETLKTEKENLETQKETLKTELEKAKTELEKNVSVYNDINRSKAKSYFNKGEALARFKAKWPNQTAFYNYDEFEKFLKQINKDLQEKNTWWTSRIILLQNPLSHFWFCLQAYADEYNYEAKIKFRYYGFNDEAEEIRVLITTRINDNFWDNSGYQKSLNKDNSIEFSLKWCFQLIDTMIEHALVNDEPKIGKKREYNCDWTWKGEIAFMPKQELQYKKL